MTKLCSEVMLQTELSASDRAAMLELMRRHYVNVHPGRFFEDLSEKQWVIVVRAAEQGALCGFSTQTLLKFEQEGVLKRSLFSGDTIIDREHWGDPALSRAWGRLALSLINQFAQDELYWFLLSQGFRTYRFLPVFFREFWPRYEATTPDSMRETLVQFARARYGQQFDAPAGVVRSHLSQYSLKPGVADITQERLQNRHVNFFQAANPGHAQGDELCCIAPLTRENFTPAAYRVIGYESATIGAF